MAAVNGSKSRPPFRRPHTFGEGRLSLCDQRKRGLHHLRLRIDIAARCLLEKRGLRHAASFSSRRSA
jgi:hypothetical protein